MDTTTLVSGEHGELSHVSEVTPRVRTLYCNPDDRRHDVLINESRSHSRYGLRGVRVGEASHLGPPRRQSSRPIAGRDVIPRIHSDGVIQVDEESDVVGVSHGSLQEVHQSRRARRRVSSNSDAPLIRRSRFAVLTESGDESDEEPLIRVVIPSRNEDDVNTVPASSGAVAAHLGPLVTTEADAGQVDEYDMTLMDADTESLSNPSAVEVEPQVPSNTSNRVRRRRLLLHWNE